MKKLKLIRQTTKSECGLCCICMIGNFYGYEMPLSYYRNKYSVGRDGLELKAIARILEQIKLNPVIYEVNSLQDFEFKDIPYIAYIDDKHYVVIKKSIRGFDIFDPSMGKYNVTIREFSERFSGYLIEVEETYDFVKKSVELSEFRYILPVIKSEIKNFIILILISITSYALSLFMPIMLQDAVNTNISGIGNRFNIVPLSRITLLIFIFIILSIIRNKFMVKLQKKLYEKISFKVIDHLFKVNYSFYDNRSRGDILFRLNLLSQIQTAISSGFVQLLLSFVFVFSLTILFLYKYFDLSFIMIILLLVNFFMIAYVNDKMRKIKQDEFKYKEKVDAIITESITNMLPIKCLNLSKTFFENYHKKFEQFIEKYEFSQYTSYKYNLYFSILFNYSPVYILVILLTIPSFQKYSIGELFALYSLLGMFFSQCLSMISEIINILTLKANIFYFNDMIDEPEFNLDGNVGVKNFDLLQIHDVSFKYSATSDNILNDINIEVSKGEKIAIVGLSGSGKTTIVKLLARLYSPLKGEISVNNCPINLISSGDFNRIISIIPQVPFFFDGTILDNITVGIENYSHKNIQEALELVNLLDEINAMPLKLNTNLSGQGGNLSGGQIQRIAIARAILSKPELIIMDEATSSLDVSNEKLIYNNFKNMGLAQIIISHRLSSIIDSDRIYYIRNGKVVEVGNHEELCAKKGYYYELFQNKL